MEKKRFQTTYQMCILISIPMLSRFCIMFGVKNRPCWMAYSKVGEPCAARSTIGGGTAKRHSKEVVACKRVVISGEFIVNWMGSHGNLLAFAGIWMGHILYTYIYITYSYGYYLWIINRKMMKNVSTILWKIDKCRTINQFWEATNIWLWQ